MTDEVVKDEGLPHGMVPADSFDAFFAANEDRLHEMLGTDSYELLYAVWFAGYDYGLRAMANFHRPLWGIDNATDS